MTLDYNDSIKIDANNDDSNNINIVKYKEIMIIIKIIRVIIIKVIMLLIVVVN